MAREARKEQIKLRATFLNNLAVGTFTAGVLTPVLAMAINGQESSSMPLALLAALVCFVVCFVIHLHAVEHLSELDK